MPISTRCIHGFMSNLIKKSWTDPNKAGLFYNKTTQLRIATDFTVTNSWNWTKLYNLLNSVNNGLEQKLKAGMCKSLGSSLGLKMNRISSGSVFQVEANPSQKSVTAVPPS